MNKGIAILIAVLVLSIAGLIGYIVAQEAKTIEEILSPQEAKTIEEILSPQEVVLAFFTAAKEQRYDDMAQYFCPEAATSVEKMGGFERWIAALPTHYIVSIKTGEVHVKDKIAEVFVHIKFEGEKDYDILPFTTRKINGAWKISE